VNSGGGRYECRHCGAVVDVPEGQRARGALVGKSGEPNYWVVRADGTEIHRCEVPDTRRRR
jgi:hypothetical protein